MNRSDIIKAKIRENDPFADLTEEQREGLLRAVDQWVAMPYDVHAQSLFDFAQYLPSKFTKGGRLYRGLQDLQPRSMTKILTADKIYPEQSFSSWTDSREVAQGFVSDHAGSIVVSKKWRDGEVFRLSEFCSLLGRNVVGKRYRMCVDEKEVIVYNGQPNTPIRVAIESVHWNGWEIDQDEWLDDPQM